LRGFLASVDGFVYEIIIREKYIENKMFLKKFLIVG
jgi:hypothetical protein